MSRFKFLMSGVRTCSRNGPNLLSPGKLQTTLLPILCSIRQFTECKTPPKSEARKGKTPSGKLDELAETEAEEIEPKGEKEPLEKFPDNKNPITGEIGGPRGPEPTRYGDWERKGRVTDF